MPDPDAWEDLPGDAHVDADAEWGPDPVPNAPPTVGADRPASPILVVPTAAPPRRAADPAAARPAGLAASALPHPPPSPLERQRLLREIGERAAELRLRRRAAGIAAMSTALVLLVVVSLLRATGGDGTRVAAGPAPTVTTLPTLEPAAPSALSPLPVPSPTTAPVLPTLTAPPPTGAVIRIGPPPTATTRPATTTTLDGGRAGDRKDGRPGWQTASARCEEAVEVPPDGGAPDAALSLALQAASTVRGGGSLSVELTISNSSNEQMVVTYQTPESRTDAWLLSSPDRAASATLSRGDPKTTSVLVPGATIGGSPGTVTLTRTVQAARCADTSAEKPPALAADTYLVGAVLQASVPGRPLKPWRSPQQQVVVTA